MGGWKSTALKETDLAALARGFDAIARLDALALRLCYHDPSDEDICDLREATQDLLTVLAMTRTVLCRSHRENGDAD